MGSRARIRAVGNSFEVVDVSNPASPTIVASLRNSALPGPFAGTNALYHACSVTISGHYAYVTAAYSNRLTIIDIANPLAPVIVSSLADATNLDFPVDVAVKGKYAYVADQATSLGRIAVVDVSNPASPQVEATADQLRDVERCLPDPPERELRLCLGGLRGDGDGDRHLQSARPARGGASDRYRASEPDDGARRRSDRQAT